MANSNNIQAKFKFKLPATSANLGPGFDSFGLALSLYNHFDIELKNSSYLIKYSNRIDDSLLNPATNLIIQSYLTTCRNNKWDSQFFTLQVNNNVPMSSGLGSSSTAVLAGTIIAHKLNCLYLNKQLILQDALAIEKHIDNIAACIYGGFVVGIEKTAKVHKVSVNQNLKCWLISPQLDVNTAQSRNKFPLMIPFKDATHNIAHAAAVSLIFNSGKFDQLKEAMDDKLHENYRIGAKLDYNSMRKKLYQLNEVYSFSLSGSGPSILILCKNITDEMHNIVQTHFNKLKLTYTAYQTQIDNIGLHLE